eukprot:m.300985 g.300985  ORF g.300985 m.300985 type:complete len:663 (+) comp40804_c0_seq14:1019-3007(+)
MSRGVIEAVNHSEWAAPLVPVPKSDGSVRLCGDYKVTVNPSLNVDAHPLPNPEDLFATLAGGVMFSKLDLANAYQQVLLDDESRKYVTVNTHRGLFQYTRLPFGIASAPAVFQEIMDKVLQGIPGVNAPAPKNVSELRSFIGLVNYYGRFVPNLSTTISPLNKLLRKESKWEWSSPQKNAFESLKETLSSATVLTHYDGKAPLKLACDASCCGIGAVIAHVMPDGQERPIAYASRSLNKAERNYSQIEKEALGLVFGVKKFHKYLYGRKFTLVTDHKALTTVLGPKTGVPTLAAARMQRWALTLSAYHYDIEFKPTDKHGNADGLSRLPLPTQSDEYETGTGVAAARLVNISQINILPVTAVRLKKATAANPILSKVLRYTQKGWPESTDASLKPYRANKDEFTVEDGCLFRGVRLVIPPSLQEEILEELHASHPGVVRMKNLARLHVWWPGIDRQIERVVRNCSGCQHSRHAPRAAPLHPWVWPTRPWERVHVDFAGPFLGSMFFIAVDSHSKWPEVIQMRSTTSEKTIAVLRSLFSCYGIPEQLVSDNGPQLTSEEFADFLKMNGVKHIRSAPHHPATNGEAERFVQTFKNAMKSQEKDEGNLQQKLSRFLLDYRSIPHSTTGAAPSVLFLGRRLRTRLDLLQPNQEKSARKAGSTAEVS